MAIKAQGQVTLIDVTDAYNVMLTSEAVSLSGNASGSVASTTVTTDVVAFCGTTQVSVVNIGTVTCPAGVTAVVSDNNKPKPKITFTCSGTIANGAEAIIPVTADDVTINKQFTFSVAKTGATGATGKGISSTVVEYQVGDNGTTAPTGTWSSTPQQTTAGQYLWTRTTVNYTSGSPTVSYSVSRHGATGATGADAITIVITSNNGIVFKNNSGTTTLTANVYKGTAQLSVANDGAVTGQGTVKWYAGTSSTGVPGKTITVSASDVTGSVAYTAKLEG